MSTQSTLTLQQKHERIEAHKKRVVGALQIGSVQSENPKNSGTFYRIMLGSDNLVYCECEAWQFCPLEHQTCKHLARFRERLVRETVQQLLRGG